ncbi:MAG: MarR family transcriptional regulator [Actinomycetota bacterium]|nr:MarR family transcriptional regulator [Actinomycetota bacterium]
MTQTTNAATRTDAGLASELRVSVMRLARRLRSERDPHNELSVSSISVLGVLSRGGECTIGQLAGYEWVQPPSMTRKVNALVEGGYVVRRPHETDGRQVLVALSERGREVIVADRRRRDAWLNRRLGELTPGERNVLRQAARLLDGLATA